MDTGKLFELWQEIMETPTEQLKKHSISNRTPFTWGIDRDMKEAVELDPEGFTAVLLLNCFRKDVFDGFAISITDILENPNYAGYIKKCKNLLDMLTDPSVTIPLEKFVASVRAAIENMDIVRSDVETMLRDPLDMGVLRRDCLRAMKELHFYQFFQGERATEHLKFLPDIHVFWNMNSLIQCAWNSPDGVSINLVKDGMNYSSYFAFVAKNGGNLSVLTDKPHEAHPLQKYMTRRPEKDFTNRVYRNHFPYGLLNVTVDYKGYLHPARGGMVPLQEKPIKIGNLADMEPDEIIWTTMMFAQIDAKLFKENYHCEELSYTSQMLEDPKVYERLNQQNMLMVRDYKPLVAPVLKVEDLEKDSQYVQHGFDEDAEAFSDVMWFYNRYKKNVPEELLNGLLPDQEKALFLLPGGISYVAPPEEVRHDNYGNQFLVEPGQENKYFADRVKGSRLLHKMSGEEFGTAEQLQNDYRWYARHNAVVSLSQQAKEEFDREHVAIEEWVQTRMEENLPNIAADLIRWTDAKNRKEEVSHPCHIGRQSLKELSEKRKSGFWSFTDGYHVYAKTKSVYPWHERYPLENLSLTRCYFEDAPCSYLYKIFATTAEDLVYLTGCSSVSELPEILQHWRNGQYTNGDGSRYTGNHLLSRVDPLAWRFENPWLDLRFGCIIGVGKKFVKNVLK